MATKPGTVSSQQVIICGHADVRLPTTTILRPGQTIMRAGLLRQLRRRVWWRDPAFERTVKFIAWSGEEQGLYGSGEYVAEVKARGDMIGGVLNFDMIGYVNVPGGHRRGRKCRI